MALAVTLFATFPIFATVEDGDRAWADRGRGHRGAVAQAEPVETAIAAYRDALESDPNDLEARWKLLRALRFKGAYVARGRDEKKEIFDEARTIGSDGIEVVEGLLRKRGLGRPEKASPAEVARVARSIPGAGELYLWDAINWGEWAQVYGKLAAVRQGAADRILREATIALEIDPDMEGAGPGRVLGRLHNQTPRVPFVTGWASDEKAVVHLRQSLASNPGDKLTMVFLAEAIRAADKRKQGEAVDLLQKVLSTPNDPRFAVEHASAQDDARRLLAEWK